MGNTDKKSTKKIFNDPLYGDNKDLKTEELGFHSYGGENYHDSIMSTDETWDEYIEKGKFDYSPDTVRSHESNKQHRGFPR